MSTYALLEAQLGSLTLPLIGFALIAMLIIIETFIKLVLASISAGSNRSLLKSAMTLLDENKDKQPELREQVLQLWLEKKLQKLTSGLRLLQLIAGIAPITGLLGTVLGLITAFDAVAGTTTGVNPALIADGLGIAMKTTAAGLIIALPSLFFASVYQLWADRRMASIAFQLNLAQLRDRDAALGCLA